MPPTTSADLRRASDGFVALVASVGVHQWELPTPCPDWPVRQLVGHVVAGSAMAAALLRGAGRNEAIAILGVDELGDDPLDATRRFLDDQVRAVDEVDSLDDLRCAHPAGPMTARQLLDLRVGDLVIHTWDLAVAVGADTTLDADLVDRVWGALRPMTPFIGRLGVFGPGPSGVLDDEAPLQARLLDLAGRRP
ncbi:MAG: TIGR03086 family metal-binding protein [Ilumatobacteraceae bacterium]